MTRHDPLAPPLAFSAEVATAIARGAPMVALESTIITHGMPYPANLETARALEAEVRAAGAIPATMAVLDGRIRVGLEPAELEALAVAREVAKLSRADLAVALVAGWTGATTVAATMICARLAGIEVFATGGIGGVHRGAETSMDISADLEELAASPVAVVCAGAKSILDLGLTLEYLETKGVPVIGYQTDTLPAFYTNESAFRVPLRADSAGEIAGIIKAQRELAFPGGLLVANPIPAEFAMPAARIDKAIAQALSEAGRDGIRGKEVTPYLLARVVALTGGDSLKANIQLVFNNVKLAARIAAAL